MDTPQPPSKPGENPAEPHESPAFSFAEFLREKLLKIVTDPADAEVIIAISDEIGKRGVGITAMMLREGADKMVNIDAVLAGLDEHQKTQLIMMRLARNSGDNGYGYAWRPGHDQKMAESLFTILGHIVQGGNWDVTRLGIRSYAGLPKLYQFADDIHAGKNTPQMNVLLEAIKKDLTALGIKPGVFMLLPEKDSDAVRGCMAVWTAMQIIIGASKKKCRIMENQAGTGDGTGFELEQNSPDGLSHMIALEYLIPGDRDDPAHDFFQIVMGSKATPNGKNFKEVVFGLDMESLIIRTDGQPHPNDLEGLKAMMMN